MDRLKAFFNRNADEEAQETSLLQQMDEASTLTWKQRATGFGICFGIGVLFSSLSIPALWTLSFTRFAILWALGSILSSGSTLFLMGPARQLKAMFSSHRLLATIVYLSTTVLTIVLAFKFQNAGLCLIMLVIQCSALIWYCATWIPGGQTYLKNLVMKNTGT